MNNWGNKPAKSYELIIKVKIEERQHIIQLGILSLCVVGMIILESLYAKRNFR